MGKSTVIRASEQSVRRRKERRRQKVERFLTRKRESGERGKRRSGKERERYIGKRASGTYVGQRKRERQSATVTMSLGADGEGGIGGSRAGCQGEGRNKESRREKEQTGESRARGGETRNSMLGPDGSERDGISQPEECLSRQRRSSETGLVQSSQISPWEGDFLFAVRVLSRWALRRRAHSALCFHLLFPFFLLPLRTLHPVLRPVQLCHLVRAHLHPPG